MPARIFCFGRCLTLVAIAMIAFSGCTTQPDPSPTPAPTAPVDEAESGQVRVALASTDLAVGPNRFVFGILDSASSPIRVPEAGLSFVYLESTPNEVRSQTGASFVKWPVGNAGVYVASVSFDQPGRWGVIIGVRGEDGTVLSGQAGFVVQPQSSSPGIGQPVPGSLNRTASDVSDLGEITSSPVPDPDLYQLTIAEAVASGKPTVVTFATPAFCQTATCGPQVEVVASVKDSFRERANFIHVEVYDNPLEMQGDPTTGRLSPLLNEWGLLSEPFTFVLDSGGLVASKYEGFVTREELEAGLGAALSP